MNWYVSVLKNYVGFSGRARRTEYWMFALVSAAITIVLTAIDVALDMRILAAIYGIAVLLPGLAVAVRRLHDTDRSGWWLLIGLVPLIGPIVLLVFLASEGTHGPNQHGADPKQVPAYA